MKNHRRRMKTCLGTRTGQKTLEEESKRHEHESAFEAITPDVGFGPSAFR